MDDRRTIRLTVPARAAFQLAALEEALGNVAEQLGHPVCLSGDLCTVIGQAGEPAGRRQQRTPQTAGI